MAVRTRRRGGAARLLAACALLLLAAAGAAAPRGAPPPPPGADYYKLLGVARDADDATIKRNYRKLALCVRRRGGRRRRPAEGCGEPSGSVARA